MAKTIMYGNLEIPETVIERLKHNIRFEGDHWIWQGAKSGQRNIPQIGCRIVGDNDQMVTKILNVARLVFILVKKVYPYQVRRDRALCSYPLCVNPDHHYAIVNRPKARSKGGRSRDVNRIPGVSL